MFDFVDSLRLYCTRSATMAVLTGMVLGPCMGCLGVYGNVHSAFMSAVPPFAVSLLLACLRGVLSNDVVCRSRESCDFGNIPGYWRDNEWPQWQAVDECCRLEDLISKLLAHPANFTYDEHVEASVLIFGDSVERFTLHDLCEVPTCHSMGMTSELTSNSVLYLRL